MLELFLSQELKLSVMFLIPVCAEVVDGHLLPGL
jgi:hypothetical protein